MNNTNSPPKGKYSSLLSSLPKSILGLILILCIGGIFFSIKESLFPFILGLALAYILNPCVEYFSRFKIPRSFASVGAVCFLLIAICLVFFFIFPLIKNELQRLLLNLPFYIERIQLKFADFTEILRKNVPLDYLPAVRNFAEQSLQEAVHWIGSEVAFFLRQSLGLKNIFSLLLITPIATFYCLKDWPSIVNTLEALLPRKHHQNIIHHIKEINHILGKFAQGQAKICIILTLYYLTSLGLINLNFFPIIGILTGILSFIPYVGALIGFFTALLVAIGQSSSPSIINFVFIIFIFGQIIEGYILTPRLVAYKIGLPPLWIIFSLIVGGNVFGFLGLVLAVPTAATLGVLVRSAAQFYKKSQLYNQ